MNGVEECRHRQRGTHSASTWATGHLYCAVLNRQMSAYCRTVGENRGQHGAGLQAHETHTHTHTHTHYTHARAHTHTPHLTQHHTLATNTKQCLDLVLMET